MKHARMILTAVAVLLTSLQPVLAQSFFERLFGAPPGQQAAPPPGQPQPQYRPQPQFAQESMSSAFASMPAPQGGDNLHVTVPVIPDPRLPVADQLFSAARRLQTRTRARRG